MHGKTIKQWLGVDGHPVSHTEKWVAALGAFLGILTTAYISARYMPAGDAWLMVGSMGASAVLLFAVPHGQLSQPWAATGGQMISAFVGVTCATLIPEPVVAAACAVSLAVLAMHYARCVHPPGGATALIAVIGGPAIHSLGYDYVWKPVMINALTILAIAFLFNNLFRWRRYPAYHAPRPEVKMAGLRIEADDINRALTEMNLVVDVADSDLVDIVHTAQRHAAERQS
ncbi:MAG TPA: HPP family protein [Mariprofundaceae bacterium]|nr:HPP family protein [Mariprofundaceae bacterium]